MEVYSAVKECFQCAPYLLNSKSFKSRQSLCQLRISAHNLKVEIGRYLGQKREKRKCTICNIGEVENEFHFIMKCTAYNRQRDKAFSKLNDLDLYEWKHCTDDQMRFIFILQAYDNYAMEIICEFIQELNAVRKSYLISP